MNDTTDDAWEPYFIEEEAKEIIGKHILVGVTFRDRSENVTGIDQFHGIIVRASHKEGIIVCLHDGAEERWIPPDLSRLEKAAPGEYRLKSTGEIVVNPDLLSTWTVYPPSEH
jgi:hypothetical protein